ncbi:MAG: thrombospondin type 3 repeat-containing protein [Myxococcota bacterium]
MRAMVTIGAAWGMLASQSAFAARVSVNEFYRSTSLGSTGDEWVELVLLDDWTAAEVDGLFVGDSTSSTAAKFAGYGLDGMADIAAVFPAGTILVVGGGAALTADHALDPATGDYTVVVLTTGVHVVSNGSTGDFASTDVVYADLDGANGNATLSASGFAVNWDSTPGAFGAIASVTIAPPDNASGAVLAVDPAGATDPTGWLVTVPAIALTPGAPNGGANTDGVLALRSCADADGDGVCDVDDQCDGAPDDLDADADGIPDGCDPCPVDASPGDDTDGDGVCNADDQCDGASDALDADGDGIPDACDRCPADAPPEDLDGDGVCNAVDACPDGDDGRDVDFDGVPDDCDGCPLDAPPDDVDGDQVCNADDRCPAGDDGVDTDADGIPDACEVAAALTLAVVGPVVPSQPVAFTVSGAAPGETVYVLATAGPSQSGPCPPSIGGQCLGLGFGIRSVGSGPADPSGTLALEVIAPRWIPASGVMTVQAVAVRGIGGVDTALSPAIEIQLGP